MEYYDSELLRLKQEVMEKEKINAQLGDLLLQQAELKNKAEELKKIMWEEQEDVDRLNGRSLTAFFYRVSGKMDEKMTKEEEEARAAAVKYDAAESELRFVDEDISRCRQRLSELSDSERIYAEALEQKRERIKSSGISGAEDIMRMEDRMAFLENQMREVSEAVDAGNRAYYIAGEVLEGLNSAKNWSTMDLLGGGVFSDIMKYDRLNQVQEKTKELQNALRGFRTELADVTERITGNIYVEMEDFLQFADFFFDGIFMDWMVYDKIAESKKRAQDTYDRIQNVIGQLHLMQNNLACEYDQTKLNLEEVVLNLRTERFLDMKHEVK